MFGASSPAPLLLLILLPLFGCLISSGWARNYQWQSSDTNNEDSTLAWAETGTSGPTIRLERRNTSKGRPELPAGAILLEDGSTTFVSSLDEFLSASERPPSANGASSTASANRVDELERESISQATVVNRSQEEAKRKSSRIAILFSGNLSNNSLEQEPGGGGGGGGGGSTRRPEASSSVEPPAKPPRHEEAERLEPLKQGSKAEEEKSHHSGEHKQDEQQQQHKQAHHKQHGSPEAKNSSGPKPILQHWQVRGLLNFTHDYPLAYSQIICGYVWPLMAAITLFTNLMIVFILTQRDMRTPTNVVLTAIAIADIFPIVVPVPWFVYLFAMGNEKEVLYPPIACYLYQHSTRSVSEVFYFLSTWLNVLLAIQDYLTACQPKLAKKYCQIRVVISQTVWLTLCAFLLNLPQATKLVYKPVKFYYNNQLTWGCKALQARWFKDLVGEYAVLYDDIFTAIIVLFVDGGPAVLLITLTALLIRQLHKQRIKGHLLMEQARTASKRRRERHRQQEYESSARVMIFVLLAFLAVKIPFATTYTLMIIQSRFEIHFVENLVDFQKAITLTDLVFVLSYPINFTIFCCCSKKFRHKCAQLLGECNHSAKLKKERFMASLSESLNTSESGSFVASMRRYSRAMSGRGSSGANSLNKQQLEQLNQLRQANLSSIDEERRDDRSLANSSVAAAALVLAGASNGEPSIGGASRSEAGSSVKNGGSPLLRRSVSDAGAKGRERRQEAGRGQDNRLAEEGRTPRRSLRRQRKSAPAPLLSSNSTHEEEEELGFGSTESIANNEPGCRVGPTSEGSQTQQNGGSVKAMLEEASLCVECILRYEQIRLGMNGPGPTTGGASLAGSVSPGSSLAGHQSNSAASQHQQMQSWSAGMPIAQPNFFQQHFFGQTHQAHHAQHFGNRRSSQMSDTSSGASWPAQPLGPPASLSALQLQLQLQQQQQQQQQLHQQPQRSNHLPQIITTTCESIREQQSQEEGTSTSGQQKQQVAAGSKLAGHTLEADATDNNSWSMSQLSGAGSPMPTHADDGRASRRGSANVGPAVEQAPPIDGEQAGEQAALGAEASSASSPSESLENVHSDSPGGERQMSAARAAERGALTSETRAQSFVAAHAAISSLLGSNKPKAASEDETSRPASREFLESNQRGRHMCPSDANSLRAERKPLDRQRSLSLSNSNLTTLPNATGLLADVLVGALLSTSGQSASKSASKGAGRWLGRAKKDKDSWRVVKRKR